MAKNDGVITPEIVPGSPADRTRAYRIRRALKKDPDEVPTEDKDWLRDYVEAQAANKGASRTHKMTYSEESAEAVGTGDAAAYAAAQAAPLLAKEEGRRIDNLINAVIAGTTASNKNTQTAYDMLLRMCGLIMDRNEQLERVHLGMLEAVRTGHIARTEAEAELIRKEAESGEDGDGINGMVSQMMPIIVAEMAKRQGLPPGNVKPKK